MNAESKELKNPRIKNPTPEDIYKQAQAWEAKFSENNNRGKEMIRFVSCGEQWDGIVSTGRELNNKETITVNVCRKELKKLMAQNSEIEFLLDAHPTTRESQNNVEESHVFSLIFTNIALTQRIRESLTECYDKSAQYGYSFGEVSYSRFGDDDLALYPNLIVHKDPSTGFWDPNAALPTKIDGDFCGIKKTLHRSEILKKFPKIDLAKCRVTESNNLVMKYWFRQEVEAEFCLLLGGQFKRKDLLTIDDENNLMTKERLSALKSKNLVDEDIELTKKEKIDKIYYKYICNHVDVCKPKEYPTSDLPMVYHAAFSIWSEQDDTFTIPFCYELKGAQKLLNLVNSQIASQAKNSSSTKWLFKPEHVKTPEQIANAKNINRKEGGMTFGGDISTIIEKPAAQVAPTLIQLSLGLRQILDDINGESLMSDSQNNVLSGEALEKITKISRVLNEKGLAVHVNFVNTVGKLFGQIVPNIITEERVIVIKKMDGSTDAMMVNEYTGTGDLRNNIKDLRNKYDYVIKGVPNEQMQQENTVKYLTQAYQISPNLLTETADVYFRNLNCKDAGELARRAAAKIDPSLIKYSQGEITKEEYDKAQQQIQQQQQQAKMQAVQDDPTYQATVAATAAEHRKADAFQKDSDTKRIKELGDIIDKEQKNEVALAKVLLDAHQGDADHTIALAESSMNLNSDMIDKMRDVIGDNDMPLQGETEPGAANAQGGENPNQSPPAGGMPDAGEAGS